MLKKAVILSALFLVGCHHDKVAEALKLPTKAEKCAALEYLSDERVDWEIRQNARLAAFKIGCLKWKK